MSGDRLSAEFRPSAEAPGAARRRLDGWLPAALSEPARATLCLLVSELVTNAIRHCPAREAPVRLEATLGAGHVRVEVRDRGAGFVPGRLEPQGADGGYGLLLVDRLASRWGVEAADGTAVWFELALTPG